MSIPFEKDYHLMRFTTFALVVCLATLSVLLSGSDGKVMSKCEIVRQLTKHKFPRTLISSWLCLVYAESGGDTSKISHGPGLSKYGLFQLEGTEWCGLGYQGGKCQMDCRGLLTDTIDDRVATCAKKKFDRHGFKGWPEWVKMCRLKPLPNIQEC